ncbi:MAG: hypothetical protein MRY63_07575 [Neomegalonema sp.]|nr:hypothetical protein [Neomegalonema sp.]
MPFFERPRMSAFTPHGTVRSIGFDLMRDCLSQKGVTLKEGLQSLPPRKFSEAIWARIDAMSEKDQGEVRADLERCFLLAEAARGDETPEMAIFDVARHDPDLDAVLSACQCNRQRAMVCCSGTTGCWPKPSCGGSAADTEIPSSGMDIMRNSLSCWQTV